MRALLRPLVRNGGGGRAAIAGRPDPPLRRPPVAALWRPARFWTTAAGGGSGEPPSAKLPVTTCDRLLKSRIAAHGPLSIADFMQEVLTAPLGGYYTTDETTGGKADGPFGAKGDFVTAPEISQVFGEMLGLWCVAAWRQAGEPAAVRLVELGPGKGTMLADILRAAGHFGGFKAALQTIVLVEASPHLRAEQAKALGCGESFVDQHAEMLATVDSPGGGQGEKGEGGAATAAEDAAVAFGVAGGEGGPVVRWYRHFDSVPAGGSPCASRRQHTLCNCHHHPEGPQLPHRHWLPLRLTLLEGAERR